MAASSPVWNSLKNTWLRLKHIRIGLMTEDPGHSVTPETRSAVEAAAAVLCDNGLCIEPFRPALLERIHELWVDVFVRMIALAFQPLVKDHKVELSPILREYLEYAASFPRLTAEDTITLLTERDLLRAHFLRQMEQNPILLMPVAPGPAFKHGEMRWLKEKHVAGFSDAFAYTQWFNLLGCAAATVPVTLSAEGLPIGVQIVGRPFDDELVLAMAGAIEKRFGWKAPAI